MKSLLPSGTKLTRQANQFVDEAKALTDEAITKHSGLIAYKDLYKIALGADAVLGGMRQDSLRPGVDSLRSIVRRIPMLILLGQTWVAKAELRRFMEITLWCTFFTHHPIEWENFQGKRGSGHSKDMRKPIAFAAHRDMNSFAEYLLEYMETEPSGIAKRLVAALEADKRHLHGAVHAGEVARQPMSNMPTDQLSEADLRALAKLCKRVFSHCIVILCAFDKTSFDHLPAIARLHFDWLVGPTLEKQIRSGPFGVAL